MSEVTDAQKQRLEAAWAAGGGKTPEGAGMERLGVASGLGEAQVRTWFKAKRKREKKKRQKRAKKAKVQAGAESSAVLESGTRDSTMPPGGPASPRAHQEACEREVNVCTELLKVRPNDSELLYRRGGAYMQLSRNCSNPTRWGSVMDQNSWDKGLRDLEAAHLLRYGT
eukprot:g5229.t1